MSLVTIIKLAEATTYGVIGFIGTYLTWENANKTMGTITGILSLAFILYRWYKELKNKNEHKTK